MNKRAIAISVFVLLCLLYVGYALWCYPRLPEQVSCHFVASGQPDAWSSKMDYLRTHFITAAIMPAMLLGFGLAMPQIPDSLISLPNSDYWLAPERRQQTLDNIMTQLLWFGSLTMLSLLYMFHRTVMVNLGQAIELSNTWITTGVYLALVTVWCIRICMRFNTRES